VAQDEVVDETNAFWDLMDALGDCRTSVGTVYLVGMPHTVLPKGHDLQFLPWDETTTPTRIGEVKK
jgi:hypothetical protein